MDFLAAAQHIALALRIFVSPYGGKSRISVLKDDLPQKLTQDMT